LFDYFCLAGKIFAQKTTAITAYQMGRFLNTYGQISKKTESRLSSIFQNLVSNVLGSRSPIVIGHFVFVLVFNLF